MASDEPNYEDLMSTYDAAFICTTGQEAAVILVTENDILLDNQASRSLFNNSKFLTELTDASPFYIGGIDSSSRGLLVKQQGYFSVYGNVAYQPHAAANVISLAEA